MSELISKETLICEIVNTQTNSDGYNSTYQTYTTAYHSGSATRQFEILDIVKKMPTVSEQEIRDKVIEEFAMKIWSWCFEHGRKERINGVKEIVIGLDSVRGGIDKIIEQMKEVE